MVRTWRYIFIHSSYCLVGVAESTPWRTCACVSVWTTAHRNRVQDTYPYTYVNPVNYEDGNGVYTLATNPSQNNGACR